MDFIGSPILAASPLCLPSLVRLACRSDECMFPQVLPPTRVFPLIRSKRTATVWRRNHKPPPVSLLHNCHTPLFRTILRVSYEEAPTRPAFITDSQSPNSRALALSRFHPEKRCVRHALEHRCTGILRAPLGLLAVLSGISFFLASPGVFLAFSFVHWGIALTLPTLAVCEIPFHTSQNSGEHSYRNDLFEEKLFRWAAKVLRCVLSSVDWTIRTAALR